MVVLDRNILSLLYIVDRFQNHQAVTNTVNAHRLEIIMLQRDQGLSHNLVFCAWS